MSPLLNNFIGSLSILCCVCHLNLPHNTSKRKTSFHIKGKICLLSLLCLHLKLFEDYIYLYNYGICWLNLYKIWTYRYCFNKDGYTTEYPDKNGNMSGTDDGVDSPNSPTAKSRRHSQQIERILYPQRYLFCY